MPAPERILHVVSEMTPLSKTGGLADVAGALPAAQAALGHDVTVVTPRYRGIETRGTSSLATLDVEVGATVRPIRLLERDAPAEPGAPRVRLVLVDCPALFDRDGLYGVGGADHPDNAHRFATFAQAAVRVTQIGDPRPTVVHAHDWQAGLVPVYHWLAASGVPAPVVFTIHNLAFQGRFEEAPGALGLPPGMHHPEALEYWGGLSFLKGGVNFSHAITTVSPRYSREILTEEYGFGFEGVLRARADDLVGILNGIDQHQWDPAADPFIPEPFSATNLGGKLAAKRELLHRFDLPADLDALSRPLAGMVSRMVDQKGFDLLAELGDRLASLGCGWVVLGTGDRRHETFWTALASRHASTIAARIEFDEGLAHLVEAGADIFVMPSRFEPCGLNQMYSLRYGTVPVVRATGGLADTVEPYEPGKGSGTGFTFEPYEAAALEGALREAIAAFADRSAWRRLQQAGMRRDRSWDASAREYVKVYRRARRRARDGWRPAWVSSSA